MENEENSLRIDLLDEGQKIQQFTEMAENQYLLNTHNVLGASSNFYKKKVFTEGISSILQGFYRNKFQNLRTSFPRLNVKNIGLILPLKDGSRIERKQQIFLE